MGRSQAPGGAGRGRGRSRRAAGMTMSACDWCMSRPHNPRMHRPTSLKALFLTGLLTLLPIWLTWIVLKFVFVLLSDTSRPLIGPLLASAARTSPDALGWLDDPWVQM